MHFLPPRPRPEEPEHPFKRALEYQGILIDLEQCPGDLRTGKDKNGQPWSVTMPCYYGEVRDTIGADGDAVDVLLPPDPAPFAPWVYVVQAKLPRSQQFDETKSVLGCTTQEEAVALFRSMYAIGGFFLGVTRWPIGAWRAAMRRPHVARSDMTTPLEKGRDWDREVKNRSVDEWRYVVRGELDTGLRKVREWGLSDGQFEEMETGDGPQIVIVNGGINDLDDLVSRHAKDLFRMDPETGSILRPVYKGTELFLDVAELDDLLKGELFPSAFAIGDPVIVSTRGGEIRGHVRAVNFSTGKVRYTVTTLGTDLESASLFNIDSGFVKPDLNGVGIVFDFDNFDNYDESGAMHDDRWPTLFVEAPVPAPHPPVPKRGPFYINPDAFWMFKGSPGDDRVSSKIRQLREEGISQQQAVAMALNMEKEGRLTDDGEYVPVDGT